MGDINAGLVKPRAIDPTTPAPTTTTAETVLPVPADASPEEVAAIKQAQAIEAQMEERPPAKAQAELEESEASKESVKAEQEAEKDDSEGHHERRALLRSEDGELQIVEAVSDDASGGEKSGD